MGSFTTRRISQNFLGEMFLVSCPMKGTLYTSTFLFSPPILIADWCIVGFVSGKRNYATNIASCLSSYNGTVFVTGLATLRTHGWWKLKHNAPPFLTDGNSV